MTSNRAVTLIQQSCISNTLIEQSPHIAYAITKKKTSILKIINFKRKKGVMSCQCRDFPQSYVIPLALATRNLFHNFLSFRSLLPFKIINFLIYYVL